MKKILSIIILSILVSVFFAAVCDTQFSDDLDVRVLDAENRPLPGASVTVYYQLSTSTGKGYTTTTPILTGEDGTMYIRITSLEKQEDHLDCNIKITAEYGGESSQKTVIANSHATLIDLKLDVYYLTVTVEDQDGELIEGALVTADGFESYTNEYGRATLRVGEGDKTVFISYMGAEREEEVTVEEDTEYEVSFYMSGIIINVIDDNGNPLAAQAELYGNVYPTDNGTIYIPNIAVSDPDVVIDYDGIEKYPEIDLDRDDEYTVIYDFTPPSVSSISDDHSEEVTKISMIIEDPGLHPSGLKPSSLTVHYDLGEGWKEAKVYSQGGNLYVAELESIPVDSIVSFEIYVEDIEGNSANIPGTFSVVQTQQNGNQTNGNGNGNSTNDELDLFELCITTVGLIIIVGLVYFAYKKYVKRES